MQRQKHRGHAKLCRSTDTNAMCLRVQNWFLYGLRSDFPYWAVYPECMRTHSLLFNLHYSMIIFHRTPVTCEYDNKFQVWRKYFIMRLERSTTYESTQCRKQFLDLRNMKYIVRSFTTCTIRLLLLSWEGEQNGIRITHRPNKKHANTFDWKITRV
jgi:hypothetical protein